MRGLFRHFVLTLRLNFRSPQALVYGYAVPVIFLIAFGGVFTADTPPLLHEMGQLLTITLLGGACFGLPTALVAERERGVWRRYRLLPSGLGSLLASVLAARVILMLTAAALQIGLARVLYHTPLPAHPLALAVGFGAVATAFLGLGLVVAAIADDVPAVQALGQCLFLPMILIGGVGVPLAVLPRWAQGVAGFMPGRYAVAALQAGLEPEAELGNRGFSLLALGVIAAASLTGGLALFRWDTARAARGRRWLALGAALAAWIAVGLAAAGTGRLSAAGTSAWEAVTDAQIDNISYADLPGDGDIVTRLAPPFTGDGERVRAGREFAERLRGWAPARTGDDARRILSLVCVASIGDVSQDPREGEIARAVWDELNAQFEAAKLRRVLAWIALDEHAGPVINGAPELGLRRHPPEWSIRVRNGLYARKFLGRLVARIRD